MWFFLLTILLLSVGTAHRDGQTKAVISHTFLLISTDFRSCSDWPSVQHPFTLFSVLLQIQMFVIYVPPNLHDLTINY